MSINSKLISIFVYSFILFVIFAINFEPFDFTFLFSLESVIYLVLLMFIYSLSISALNFLFVAKGFTNKSSYVQAFLAACFAVGVFTFYQDVLSSTITTLIVLAPFVITYFSTKRLKKIYTITPVYASIKQSFKVSSFFISLAMAFSFYTYANVNSQNPKLTKAVDKTIDQATRVSLSFAGQAAQQKFEDQITDLSPEEKKVYEENKELVDGVFNMYQNQLMQGSQSLINDPIFVESIEQIKSVVFRLVDKYQTQILLLGSFGVFGFSQFIFSISGLILSPINLVVFKVMVSAGYFKKLKEKEEVERYLV